MQRIPLVPLEDMPDPAATSGNSSIARIMAHAPTAMAGFKGLAEAIFARLQLDPCERELAVLATVRLEGGTYQWVQHEHICSIFGIPDAKVEAIRAGDFQSGAFDERERALLSFVEQAVLNVRVDDPVFDEMLRHFSYREIVETLFTIGNYMMIARISEIARIPPDPPVGIVSLRNAEARVKAENDSLLS